MEHHNYFATVATVALQQRGRVHYLLTRQMLTDCKILSTYTQQ